MSERNHEPQRLLESLLAPEEPQQDGPEPLPAPGLP